MSAAESETGLLFPCFQNFLQVQQLEELCRSHKSNGSMGNLVQSSTILEYDLGGEGDLFKAPEPIIEEPMMDLDPMTAAISMISGGDDVISVQALKVADMESMQSEVYYECKKDLLAKEATETPLSEVLNIKISPLLGTNEDTISEGKSFTQGVFLKSFSSNFLDFPGMDFEVIYGMRRAFSEGDIKALDNRNASVPVIHSSYREQQHMCTAEDRRHKLSRYRNKRAKRNFGRKIKYACRKALADNQPRVRGRFAKTDEPDVVKNY